MKKIINSKTIPYIVIISSIIALGLRLWTIGDGADAFGLYPSRPLAWGALWVFTGLVAAMILIAIRPLKTTGSYAENYPRSIPGMIGNLLAGAVFFLSGWQQLGSEADGIVNLLTGIFGLAAGGAMVVLAVFRLQGKKPNFLLHGVVCLYLALRLFNRCQIWSNEPQLGTLVIPFLASMALMLAAYQRTCFDVELGNRRHALLWSLLGTYFCIVAVLSFEEVLFYGACALWLMTDLCSLRPMKRKKAPETAPKQSVPETDTKPHTPEEMSLEELENWLQNPEQK